MGFIEEGRQLFQDFVAPEIRVIEARLDVVEKKIDGLEARMEKRFDSADKRFEGVKGKIDRVQLTLDTKLERNQSQIMDTLHRMEIQNQILERIARIESKLQNVA